MSKPKLAKFAELKTFPNVLQNFSFRNPSLTGCKGEKKDLKGKWNSNFFGNENPIVLELGCGKGDYTVELAAHEAAKNFIGVDLKGSRIWTGAKRALELKLPNAAFVRTRIEMLPHFFAPSEVSEIWLTFPDPYPKRSKANKRLISPFFLEKYRQFCRPGAVIHLKTDEPALFHYAVQAASLAPCKILTMIEDIYRNGPPAGELAIQTYYEKMHLEEGRTIRYLKFLLH
ncbi:MAG TPA: tRNA (guanosine(46)-N7)-methyltransferase TrmB [Chitinophagales bacterium]|nr:tRNA (guanosine(46)-N7)-methyltransferase TrmB [Chitinophagales bacterium]